MPKKMALLIGVSEYGEDIPNLSAPPNDVAAMERILSDRNLGGFDPNWITTLINPDLAEMQIAIGNLFSQSERDDLALLFFSGHGITDDDNHLYLGTNITAKNNFVATAVTANFVQKQLSNSYCRRKVIILDCCYSGAFDNGWHTKSVGLDLNQQLGAEGTAILTSSSSTQTSFEQENAALSLYTQYLVEGIEKGAADIDKDGKIYVQELHNYAKKKVKAVKPNMKPEIILEKEGYNILLAQAPRDPQAEYRRLVEKYAKNGVLPNVALLILQSKRTELGLENGEAKQIEAEVLEPFRRRRENLEKYRQVLLNEVENQFPLDEHTQELLKTYQQDVLGLRDEDVTNIWAEIVTPLEETRPELPTPKPEIPKKIPEPTPELKTFEFETGTLKEKITEQKSGLLGLSRTTVSTWEIQRQRNSAEYFIENLGHGVTLDMVKIPAGEFLMGSPESEEGRLDSESPQHRVTVDSFFMGKYPVTQAQWKAVASLPKLHLDLNPDPSEFKGENRPVEQVSWYDAIEFCARLSKYTGKSYLLPSEAQWEYACRAGTTTPFHFGETISTDVANYDGNGTYGSGSQGVYRQETTPVGNFKVANNFGLFDLHGNVWEWCADPWHKNYEGAPTDGSVWDENSDGNIYLNYVDNLVNLMNLESDTRVVLRGGSWFDFPFGCRSAIRYYYDRRDNRLSHTYGFRVVCVAGRTL
ncbi:MAG: SUMF1/EgtB/PvdO family nonheme iron enzyme [Cyanobacteria bacterium J06592_8]